MGQRHQLYVIAKADGRYRTLAALHRQRGYGYWAVKRCLDMLKAILANASALRLEVCKAAQLDWKKEVEAGVEESKMNTIFPFTTTCLMALTGDKWLLPITADPTRQDNNDGITVFDISDPDQPRYAFVSLPGSEHDDDIERLVILDAATYLRLYNDPAGSPDLVEELNPFTLIGAEALNSAWSPLRFRDSCERHLPQKVSNLMKPANPEVSLRDQTMRGVILNGFDHDPQDLAWYDGAAQLPDFGHKIRDTLQAQPELLDQPSGLAILKRLVQDQSEVDLSVFSTMHPWQALDIVQSLNRKAVVTLPSITDLTLPDLEALLDTGNLLELHLGETPQMPLQDALNSISGKPLEALTSSSLYRLTIEQVYMKRKVRAQQLPNSPSGTQAGYPVSQVLLVQQGPVPDDNIPSLEGSEGLAWSKGLAMPYKEGGEETPDVVPITLTEAMLSLDRLLSQLPGLVAGLHSGGEEPPGTWRSFLCSGNFVSNTIAARKLALGHGDRVMPIPADLYNIYRQFAFCSIEIPPPAEPLEQGKWTLLVLHECRFDYTNDFPSSRLRYAFVTLDANDKLVCLGVEMFEQCLLLHDLYRADDVEARRRLLETFEERMKNPECEHPQQVGRCSPAEAAEALRLVEMFAEERLKLFERRRHILEDPRFE